MLSTWLPRFLVTIAIALSFALFRRMAPPHARMAGHRYDEAQVPEPLPTGVIGGAMWSVGIPLAMFFFVLRGANHLWASFGGPSLLTQYAPQAIWCFFPGFVLPYRSHGLSQSGICAEWAVGKKLRASRTRLIANAGLIRSGS